MSGKRQILGVNVGGSSILVIFVLLCLTTFATLSLVSANADYKLTQKTVQAVDDYYAADAKATERLAEIDQLLVGCQADAAGSAAYFSVVSNALNSLGEQFLLEQTDSGAMQVSFSCPVNEEHRLAVRLELNGPALPDAERYRILSWQLESISEWEAGEEDLNLWPGLEEEAGLFTGELPI